MKHSRIGMDISKHIFHIVELNHAGKIKTRRKLRRNQVLKWFANHEPCEVGMEACGGSHYWGRELRKLGYRVKLLPAQHVKAYVMGNKNDYNDAVAIAEAMDRPRIHCVAIKTVEQQDIQALHRMRKALVEERVALCNQLRGLISEYGICINQGIRALRTAIPHLLEDAENGLTDLFRELLQQKYQQLQELDEHMAYFTQKMDEQAKQNEVIKRLQTIPGFGPIVASTFHSVIGDGQGFAKGRDVSASLGLVPRQHSTGGKEVLLGISKRGDKYLRSLLVHGARSVVKHAEKKEDALSRWVMRLSERRGKNKATVALANKLARIAWVVTTKGMSYEPRYLANNTAQPLNMEVR